MSLDKIWSREIDNCSNASSAEQVNALLLFVNAHNKARVAVELGLSASITEAFSIMSDAIESVAFAHRIHLQPSLVNMWLEKAGDETKLKKAFRGDGESQLFNGLPELYNLWVESSHIGSRSVVGSLQQRFANEKAPTYLQLKYDYTSSRDLPAIAGLLLTLLFAISYMEEAFFTDFRARLQLDSVLMKMRARFQSEKEICRKYISGRYGIALRGGTSAGSC